MSDSLGVIHAHLLGFSSEDLRGELEKDEKGTVAVGMAVSACYLPWGIHSLPATVSLGPVCGWFPLPAHLPPPCLPSTPLPVHTSQRPLPQATGACRPVARSRSALPLRMLRLGKACQSPHKPLSPLSPLPNLLRPLLGTGVVCRGEGKQEETEDKGGGSYSCGILGEWDPSPQGGAGGQARLCLERI